MRVFPRGERRPGCSPPCTSDCRNLAKSFGPTSHLPGHKLLVPDFQKDPVCYLKKAFLLVDDIMEDTMRFRDETPNAKAIIQLQTLSVRLKSCFTKDYEKQDKVSGSWTWSAIE